MPRLCCTDKSGFQSVLSGIEICPGRVSLRLQRGLSIGPFWNWNYRYSIATPSRSLTFNRSFLELKCYSASTMGLLTSLSIGPFWNWNHLSTEYSLKALILSIGPFWNWNPDRRTDQPIAPILSIGPFWNWNLRCASPWRKTIKRLSIGPFWNWNANDPDRVMYENFSFNRSFLELKYLFTD